MVVMVVTCTIIDILMIRKKKETRTVITNALTFFSIMKGHWVLLQAQVIVFYMKVFPISRAIFPLRLTLLRVNIGLLLSSSVLLLLLLLLLQLLLLQTYYFT